MDMSELLRFAGAVSSATGGDTSKMDRLRDEMNAAAEERKKNEAQMSGRAAGEASRSVGADALEMTAGAQPYSYQYTRAMRAMGAPSGDRYGPMADDLERSKLGAAVVSRVEPDGMRVVDIPGLTMANTAAIGQLARERADQRSQGEDALHRLQRDKASQDYAAASSNLQTQIDRLRNRYAGGGVY